MSQCVQINPHAEALHVSREFGQVLDEIAGDFEIRYCFIDPSPEAIARLQALAPERREQKEAIASIIELLARGEEVELLYG